MPRPHITLEGCAVDSVTPHERIYGRRAADWWTIRPWHIALFLLVVILSTYGFAEAVDRWADEQTIEAARAAGMVAHQIQTSCGL